LKYIFVAGAPGSKWSSVVKNIYYSADIDRSDYCDEWTYYHDAGDTGVKDLMHLGAYFDPGMISPLPEDLTTLNREQLEALFAPPFKFKESKGIRIIKSHVFSNHIEHLRKLFPEVPIVIVHRSDDSCLGWWVKCGHFDITYPSYAEYYQNLREMSRIIAEQNNNIETAMYNYNGHEPRNNRQLTQRLGLSPVPEQYSQNYATSDITVKVI
jgi:hypothetical protein